MRLSDELVNSIAEMIEAGTSAAEINRRLRLDEIDAGELECSSHRSIITLLRRQEELVEENPKLLQLAKAIDLFNQSLKDEIEKHDKKTNHII